MTIRELIHKLTALREPNRKVVFMYGGKVLDIELTDNTGADKVALYLKEIEASAVAEEEAPAKEEVKSTTKAKKSSKKEEAVEETVEAVAEEASTTEEADA